MKIKTTLLTTVLVPMIFLSIGKSQNLSLQDDLNEGTHIEFIMHSPSLEDNFLGDSQDRWVSVYLPPGYYSSPDKHYSVIYFLHSYTGDHTTFFGGLWENVDFKTICYDLIDSVEINPMIVVSPNSYNKYWGSFYTNSLVTGNWADFIVGDLINYIDNNFRTLPQRESRGLAGHSMGGYGTLWLIMNYPSVFNAAYMLSGNPELEELYLENNRDNMIEANNAESLEGLSWRTVVCIAAAAAFTPDSFAPPFYAQFPLDDSGVRIDSIWNKWLQHDPLYLLPSYKDSLMQLKAIQFDVGINDADHGFISSNRNFSEALSNLNIPHVFEEHDGGHSDKLAERIETKLLPFFSEDLSDTMITDTSLYNLIEWQGIEIKENYRLNETIMLDTSAWVSDSVSYVIVSGNPDNIFSIDNNAREICADSLKLDYEEKTYHNLLIAATYQNGDEVLEDTAFMFIRIENINDNPPVINDTIFYIEENSSKYTPVGFVQATDPDDNLLDFAIIDGNINETFSITNSGLVRVANVDSLDYESIPQFILTVVVTEKEGPFSDTAFVTINLNDVVDIRAHESMNKLRIHPNPSDDIINIEIENPINTTLEIYNISGKLVFSKALNSKVEKIDVSGLSEGIYIVKVMHDSAVYYGKVMVR
jgi:S-formylglutathione hydrolase